jgi:hypothetical protein
MIRTVAAIATGVVLTGAALLPSLAGAQPAPGAPCAGGAVPFTTSFVDNVQLIGVNQPHVAFVHGGAVIGIAETVTQTENVAGVQGLTQTVIANGFGQPAVSLGVPDYLLEAYGGNITAIERDLKAGLLKNRGACPAR